MIGVSLQSNEILAGQAIEARAYDEAVQLLRPLAERNSEYALLALGWIYETGATGTADKDAARSFYEHAVSQGSATGCLYLGRLLSNEGDEKAAKAIFERGASLGNNECKSELARLSESADAKAAKQAIEEECYEEAVRLLRPLAERNSEYALLSLGWIYETGAVGASDKDVARCYYERAVSQGSAAACFDLGRMLLGEGNEAQARAVFETGAERGDIPSTSELGRMMVEGCGGGTDAAAGTALLKRAAAEGHIFAQRALLAIEERNAQSLLQKLVAKLKIVVLATKGARLFLKDRYSDKLR